MSVERYRFTNEWTMQREHEHPFRWVLRDGYGKVVDREHTGGHA